MILTLNKLRITAAINFGTMFSTHGSIASTSLNLGQMNFILGINLWNNKIIKISNSPVFYRRWYNKHIYFIKDILNPEGKILSFKANTSDTEATLLGLNLSISNGFGSSKIFDKSDDFDFDIVNYPF